MTDGEAKKVKGERSDGMMKLRAKQEDAAGKDRKRGKRIKCKVGELDEELYAAVSCPLFFPSASEKMIALIIFLKEHFSCHCITSRH